MATQISTTSTAEVLPGQWPGRVSLQETTYGPDKQQSGREKRSESYKHAFAVHSQARTSCLTPGHEGPPLSFVGFRNLMVLVILVSNLRLMIENFRKYGVLICISCHDYRRQDVKFGAILFLMTPCHLFVAYMIELIAAQEVKGAIGRAKKKDINSTTELQSRRQQFAPTWYLIAFAHGINATLNLVVASYVVYYHIYHPGIGTLCEMHAVIVWLKVCSYALTNRDLRHALLTEAPTSTIPQLYRACPYPENISLSNLTYFWFAPTLLYQPVYPRTSHVSRPGLLHLEAP